MIIGNINDTAEVEKLHPLFRKAFQWIRANYRTIHESGVKQVKIDGDQLFANIDVATMRTADEQIFELHRRYIDIHIPVDKTETIGWMPEYLLRNVKDEYDATLDRAFFTDRPLQYFTIQPGEFCIMFPHDAHAPIIGEGKIRKICMKILVEGK
jgi:biofilm protein TabA